MVLKKKIKKATSKGNGMFNEYINFFISNLVNEREKLIKIKKTIIKLYYQRCNIIIQNYYN